jgi:hypothetical protein
MYKEFFGTLAYFFVVLKPCSIYITFYNRKYTKVFEVIFWGPIDLSSYTYI